MSKIRFVGLDVHADTIAVAVADTDGDGRGRPVAGHNSESGGIDPQTGEEAGAGRPTGSASATRRDRRAMCCIGN